MCANCLGIYRNSTYYLDAREEKKRYKAHDNDVNDRRYQNFVSPIVNYVLENFKPEHRGLDFGSGTAPVISKMLHDKTYSIDQYDPFFSNKIELLNEKYDYIVCCEVVEHFHYPDVEFERLQRMLKRGGALVCMTHLYTEEIAFKDWYYKGDPTHVFFYRPGTIHFIAENYGFSGVEINNRLFVLKS